jgi:hypothetical protein
LEERHEGDEESVTDDHHPGDDRQDELFEAPLGEEVCTSLSPASPSTVMPAMLLAPPSGANIG